MASEKKNLLVRIAKYSLKTLLAIFVLLFSLLLIINLPPVQKILTTKVSEYLSEKTGGTFSINSIKFSLSINIVVEGINVKDPQNDPVFSAARIVGNANIFDLVKGKLYIDYLALEEGRFTLTETNDRQNIDFIIEAFSSEDPDTTSTTTVTFGRISLTRSAFRYRSMTNSIDYQLDIGSLKAVSSHLSLNPNNIRFGNLLLRDTESRLISQASDAADTASQTDKALIPLDLGSGFDFEIHKLDLENIHFAYHLGEIKDPSRFDPDHIIIDSVTLKGSGILFSKDSLQAEFTDLTAHMRSLPIRNSRLTLRINDHQLKLDDLKVNTDKSNIQLNGSLHYQQWSTLLTNMEKHRIRLTGEGNVHLSDLRYFYTDTLFSKLDISLVDYALDLDGDINNLLVNNAQMSISENNNAAFRGMIRNIADQDRISWDSVRLNARLTEQMLRALSGEQAVNRSLPPTVNLALGSTGSLDSQFLNLQVSSLWGNASANGTIRFSDSIYYIDMDAGLRNIASGLVSGVDKLGRADLDIRFRGQSDLKSVAGNFSTDISRVNYDSYRITKISARGEISPNLVAYNVISRDPNAHLEIEGEVDFSQSIKVETKLKISSLRPSAFMDIDSALYIDGHVEGALFSDKGTTGVDITSGLGVTTDTLRYEIDSIVLKSHFSDTLSSIDFWTKDLSGTFESNFPVAKFPAVTGKFLGDFFTAPVFPAEELEGNQGFTIKIEANNPELLNVLIPDFNYLEGLVINARFNKETNRLDVELELNSVKYQKISLDTLRAEIYVENRTIHINSTLDKIGYDTLSAEHMKASFIARNDTVWSSLKLLDNEALTKFQINPTLTWYDEMYALLTDSIIVNRNLLEVNQTKPIRFSKSNIHFHDYQISYQDQQLAIQGDLDSLQLRAQNLNLQPVGSIITPDSTSVLAGLLNANFFYYQRSGELELDAKIDSLRIFDSPAMQLTASAGRESDHYPFNVRIDQGEEGNVVIGGKYLRDVSTDPLDAHLEFNWSEIKYFQPFLKEYVSNLTGQLRGDIIIKGNLDKPVLEGYIQFLNTAIETRQPRLDIRIPDEKVGINNNGIRLDDFRILDKNDNPLEFGGYLRTEDYIHYTYDFVLNTEEFLFLDNPREDDYFIQGQLLMGASMNVTGTLRNAEIEADLEVKPPTNLTYVLPPEELELISDEGVVVFVDKDLPKDTTMTLNEHNEIYYDSLISGLPGVSFNSTIKIIEGTKFKVIIDPRSGDYMEIKGNGDLDLSFDKTGKLDLTGTYVITEGIYQLSFYNVVKKAFNLKEGSFIRWSGGPLEGELQMEATNTLKASSLGLIGQEISEAEREQYSGLLPYVVGINIKGQISEPDVSFSLNLPADERSNYPALATKLSRLNQPEYESELNKQIFSLLVLGNFIPETGNPSRSYDPTVATTALSNSVNGILTRQLNKFTGQYIQGLDIDIGLQSYRSQGEELSTTRTAMDFSVSKEFFNERLKLQAGGTYDVEGTYTGVSPANSNFRGNMAIIYDLTESGNKKIKVFNNETYDIIYHEVRNTGVALIFIREFDKVEK